MNPDLTGYINSVDSQWQRDTLLKLREIIHKTQPDVEEKIKWGSAAFDYNGPLIWAFCAQKWVHISFTQGALLDDKHGLFEPTENKAQRTIKIRQNDPFPEQAIKELVAQAIINNTEGKKISYTAARPRGKSFSLPKKYQTLLKKEKLLESFRDRPYYQQSGWIRWILSAKQASTRARRTGQMISELKDGNKYMKMPW